MTLPFRRRHHDDENAHDRARTAWSSAMLEPLQSDQAAWLEAHLAGCGECRLERDAYLEDRQLLRSLRDQAPEPPRDLWARTAAAIELEADRHARPGLFRSRVPLGVMAGLLVAIVVVAASFYPRAGIPIGPTPASSAVAVVSPAPEASPIQVQTAALGWLEANADGTYQLLRADVDQVCPDASSGCAPLTTSSQLQIKLQSKPQQIVAAPHSNQIVVVGSGEGSASGTVLVVPVPTSSTGPASTPTVTPSQPVSATSRPSATPPPLASATPSSSPELSSGPSPAPTPTGAQSIANGVTVIGDTAYSADGRYLAFSARPIDGSTGPDLYIWTVGTPTAIAVTTDHQTYFSSWFGDQVIASRVITGGGLVPDASPGASAVGAPATTPTTQPSAESSAAPSGAPEAHPVSFLFDPATGRSVDLAVPDAWLPAIDASGRFVTYWLGTLRPDATGTGWMPGNGRLVLDGWIQGLAGAPAASPGATPSIGTLPSPTAKPASSEAPGSPEPSGSPEIVGPAGTPIDLVAGPISSFEARFDPSGTRLAVWVANGDDPTIGSLRLVLLDRGRGALKTDLAPLVSTPAVRGISIAEGRLAWVTPPGQDGQQSVVQVLAWSGDDFGQVETVPAGQLYIVR